MKLFRLWSEGDIGEDYYIFPSKQEALDWGYNSWIAQYADEAELLFQMGFTTREDFIDNMLSTQELELVGVLPR